MMRIGKLIIAILVCEGVGVASSLVTSSAISSWYAGLEKPFLDPPDWVFAPVWAVLYFLMGFSAFLVWDKGLKNREVRMGLSVFGIQLGLNAMWTILFFRLQSSGVAYLCILLLWCAIAWNISSFFHVSRLAAFLLIPYLAWVTFAVYLNASLWILNS